MTGQKACKYRIEAGARDFTHLLAKSGGGSREAVTEQQKLHVPRECKGSGLHKIHVQNLAEVSCDRAKSL